MTYEQTLEYLFTRLPMFSKTGAEAFKADLTNILLLCERLGNPQHKFRSIHVAGTNGKGSTSHMLAAVLQQLGYKTGLYTSPHLQDFRERIRINGEMIATKEVIAFTQSLLPLIEEIKPSFFEITVAMAFNHFAHEKVDIAVVEVGLGGRLDSTNIILPEVSVITNIGLDHMDILGDTLEKISAEKAGIIKPGIPVVIGETLPESKPVFLKTASEQQAPISFAAERFHVSGWSVSDNRAHITLTDNENPSSPRAYTLDLIGIYQQKNICTVLSAIDLLRQRGWQISEAAIRSGLQQTKTLTGLSGRWEKIWKQPAVYIDVAHNADGIRQLVEQLKTMTCKRLHIVLGLVKDKDISLMLSLLPRQADYYFTKAQIPRALDPDVLQQQAAQHFLHGEAFSSVNHALKTAFSHADARDLIVICGSIFVAAEVDLQVAGIKSSANPIV